MKNILALIFVILFSGMTIHHDLNMTVTDLSCKEKKLQLKIKFFADDLQATLATYTKAPVDIINAPVDLQKENIRKYIDQRLSVWTNEQPIKLKFKSAYLSKEVVYAEYESGLLDANKIRTVKIRDVLMFDDFPEQKNIVNIQLAGKTEMLSFENGSGKKVQQVTIK